MRQFKNIIIAVLAVIILAGSSMAGPTHLGPNNSIYTTSTPVIGSFGFWSRTQSPNVITTNTPGDGILTTGTITGGTFTDGTASLTSGVMTGMDIDGNWAWTGDDAVLDCSDGSKSVNIGTDHFEFRAGSLNWLKFDVTNQLIDFGDAAINNPAYNFLGTGLASFGGPVNIAGITKLDDSLHIKEITTPTAVADYGAIYTKANNELFFQDGDGNEHLLHGDAFSDMWFHGATDTITISAADTFVLIDSFVNIRGEDDLGNVVASIANSEFVIGTNGEGTYNASFHCSITSNGANSEKVVVIGCEFATPRNITLASNTTPIIIESVGHQLSDGDMVTIAGCTGNTAANGDWIVDSSDADNFTIIDLQRANSVGNGVYDSGTGDIDIIFFGNLLSCFPDGLYTLCCSAADEVSSISSLSSTS